MLRHPPSVSKPLLPLLIPPAVIATLATSMCSMWSLGRVAVNTHIEVLCPMGGDDLFRFAPPASESHPRKACGTLGLNSIADRGERMTALCNVPPWGHPTKTSTDLRKAPMRRGQRRHGAVVVSREENHFTRWAFKWDACIDCGTTERPHRAHGRCKRCDDRWRYQCHAQPS